VTPGKLRPKNQALSPLPAGPPAPNSITPLFSARDAVDSSETLQWYADRMAEAEQIVCFTVAFNIDKFFQEVIARDNDVLFAAGVYLGEGALANFLAERSNPLNTNDYIHDKFMLVDPLGDDPL
jgi:hypothetical protein